jgi:ABC-type transporter Mla subunit MlaD
MAGQSLVDQAQQAGETLQQSMQEAQLNTRQVLEQISGDMVLQLGHVHQQYSTTLEQSQQSMARLVTLQEGHIGSWQELVQTLTPALSQLNQSAGQLDQVIQTLQASMVPATTVSENFVVASTQLQAVFPNIAETADAYHRFNQSLQSASATLSDTAEKYIRAGSGMGGLLGQIEQSLDLQNQSNTAVSSTLGGVQHTIQNLEPIVRLMQQASQDMRAVSEGSTSTIDTMKQATESQQNSVNQMGELSQQLLTTLSGQSGRLIELTNQMEQLQQVLTVGVDAFAQTLPRSVDGTLVQFDAVLAEGVLRINGSIERLREAMDDLIEQLER